MRFRGRRQIWRDMRAAALAQSAPLDPKFTPADLARLQRSMLGSIVHPTDSDYQNQRQLSNFAFQQYPLFIAFCEVAEDVRHCLAFAQRHDTSFVVRSGGHSTAGFSIGSGMVIDVSRLNSITIDAANRLAMVGPGARLSHLASELSEMGLHVPVGICPDVCVGGFMQGGGYGLTSRQYGMNCDNVVEVKMMLANGRVVVANETQNECVFWAVRGGTGGNFGVLLQITYRLHPIGDVWGFGYDWPLRDGNDSDVRRGACLLAALQRDYMLRGKSDRLLGYQLFIGWQHKVPGLMLRGLYNGPEAGGRAALKPLLDEVPGYKEVFDRKGSFAHVNRVVYDLPVAIPDVPDLAREDKQSGYIARQLTDDEWRSVIREFLKSPNQGSFFAIEPYGGAIAAPKPPNAFVHRAVDMDVYVDVFWMTDEEQVAAVRFLDGFMKFMAEFFNGQSYQNYPRASQTDYRELYWGQPTFDRLLAVKKLCDPTGAFTGLQGITPVGAERPLPACAPLRFVRPAKKT
jgi:FAD/FMN-containing dehydrogenase